MSGERYIIGHSRGGSVAYLYAYSRLMRGLRVDGVYVWAPACPGNNAITAKFAEAGLAVRAFRNMHAPTDPVPEVPFNLQLVDEEYEQPKAFEIINEVPPAGDDWGLLQSHHFECYQAGCAKLDQGTWALPLNTACTLAARLYAEPLSGWDQLIPVDGSYWAVKYLPNDVKVAISRGSTTGNDWLDNFKAWQIDRLGARVSAGFWLGFAPVLEELDAALD